jgi:hypothetical protein
MNPQTIQINISMFQTKTLTNSPITIIIPINIPFSRNLISNFLIRSNTSVLLDILGKELHFFLSMIVGGARLDVLLLSISYFVLVWAFMLFYQPKVMENQRKMIQFSPQLTKARQTIL